MIELIVIGISLVYLTWYITDYQKLRKEAFRYLRETYPQTDVYEIDWLHGLFSPFSLEDGYKVLYCKLAKKEAKNDPPWNYWNNRTNGSLYMKHGLVEHDSIVKSSDFK